MNKWVSDPQLCLGNQTPSGTNFLVWAHGVVVSCLFRDYFRLLKWSLYVELVRLEVGGRGLNFR